MKPLQDEILQIKFDARIEDSSELVAVWAKMKLPTGCEVSKSFIYTPYMNHKKSQQTSTQVTARAML